MIVMEIVDRDELFTSLPVQEADFKWNSGSKLNQRLWLLAQRAAVLVKLRSHRVFHLLVEYSTSRDLKGVQ